MNDETALYIIIGILYISIFLLIFAVFNTATVDNVHKELNKLSNVKCEGVNNFYSGNGFEWDVTILQDYYNNIYSGQLATIENQTKIYNFNDLLNNRDYIDCEDISFMIMCLGHKYDKDCEYYTIIGKNVMSHRGVICDKNIIY